MRAVRLRASEISAVRLSWLFPPFVVVVAIVGRLRQLSCAPGCPAIVSRRSVSAFNENTTLGLRAAASAPPSLQVFDGLRRVAGRAGSLGTNDRRDGRISAWAKTL